MLQLVLGRAGYGKTEYVFSSIKKLVEEGNDNIVLITPEQFSFIAERRLLTDLGEANIHCVESTSFTRLAEGITNLYGGNSLPTLSKGAKAVKMKEAIEAVQDGLTVFNKGKITNSFVSSVISIYDEMKSCRVFADDILNASNNTDKEILKRKLNDVSLIIDSYDALINNEFNDPANELTRLYEKLTGLTYFKDKIVFIDGFSGFVAQEYKVLEVILKQAKTVYITFCTDSYLNADKYDLFSYVNSNIQILLHEVIKRAGVTSLKPIFLDGENRFKNEELALVEKYAFSNIKESSDLVPEGISLYCANSICDECDRTALEISRLLRQGYKANEIAVICRDLDKYEREIGYSFNKFGVPYYNDERQSVTSQPLIMFVNFLLRVIIYSYRSEDVFSLLKTGLTALKEEEINALENYVFMWSINGSAWKKEFIKSTKGFTENISDSDRAALESLNKSREYIVNSLMKFKRVSKDSNVQSMCKAVYTAIKDFDTANQLKALAAELENSGKSALAAEQGRIWDMLMDILDRLVLVAGSKKVSINEFYSLFNLMVSNEDLGSIPIGLDNVQLGSADRIRCDNPRAVFILGANEGEFPKSVVSAGLFSESDRQELIKNHFKLYSYGETINAQEKYFAYMACSCASEKLYVSYISNSESGSPSLIINGIKTVFNNVSINHRPSELSVDMLESNDNAFEILASSVNENSEFVTTLEKYFEGVESYKSRLEAIRSLNNDDELELNDKNTAIELFGKNMYLSASRIEDYYNCSFRYFCKFGLLAKPRVKAQMDPMQTGTVIHYVLEQILTEKGSKGLTEMTDSEITISVNGYLSSYLNTKMGDAEQFTPRFKYQFLRLSKMLVYVVIRLRDEFLHSDFEAKAFELKIGNGTDGESVKSKVFTLDDGGTVEIKGAVDRVDTFESNGKKYVRVVDYKSGFKDFKLSDILYGLNLQMFIYLFTLSQSKGEYSGVSSGVLYMPSTRNLISLERGATEENIKAEENKSLKMKGVVLNDVDNEIAKHMEHELSGKYIPVKYVKKTDSLTGNIVTLEELGRIAKKIDELIVSMGASLHSGKISQNPVNGKGHDKTCEFCDYSAVCMNRKEIAFRDIEELDNAQVIETIKEEQNA